MGWTIRSPAELRCALEDYTTLADAQPVPGDGGDQVGDLQTKDRLYRLLAQNQAIDGGMKALLWTDRIAWRVLNQFYRQGLHVERWGWMVPAKGAGLPVPVCLRGVFACGIPGDHRYGSNKPKDCPHGAVCRESAAAFGEVLTAAIEHLFTLIESARGGRCTPPVDRAGEVR